MVEANLLNIKGVKIMKIVAIVNTCGTYTDKKTGEKVKYNTKKVVGLSEYTKDGDKQTFLEVCKCSDDFALPVGSDFEPVYDKFGRIVGKR